MSRRPQLWVLAVVCLAVVRPASAQVGGGTYATPAHVSAVQGQAAIQRDGETSSLVENLPLLESDRLSAGSGRVEVLLPDGSALALDHGSTLDLRAGGIIQLFGGRLVFAVTDAREGGAEYGYQVQVPGGVVRLLTGGDYRVSAAPAGGTAGVDVAVLRGRAMLAAGNTSYAVSAGQRLRLAGGRAAVRVAFDTAAGDPFYRWAGALTARRAGARSRAYLPSALHAYAGTFDRDGTWVSVPDYGWVWYPRVAVGWRPYYDGYWVPYNWGWTWVGSGPWLWPTHHYGRWGYGARGWFWIPKPYWGPAWVSWGLATGYVSWCPLGWDDAPVFGLSFASSSGSRYNAWLGWTVVPARAFGRGRRVSAVALRGDALRVVERASFTVRRAPPAVPPAAGRGIRGRWAPVRRPR